jgi:NAD(P)-dependent dehydrogenase (short-subunit alcohol dehydrogenase family)
MSTATKGAIIAFTRALANQIVGKTGIRVNAVAPGYVLFLTLSPSNRLTHSLLRSYRNHLAFGLLDVQQGEHQSSS